MIAKLTDHINGKQWYQRLSEVEYSINNNINKSTGQSPSHLVFGIHQRGPYPDRIKEFVDENITPPTRDLDHLRKQAADRVLRSQQVQKEYFDRKHKTPREYQIGDLIMIRNFDSTPGMFKKLVPLFRFFWIKFKRFLEMIGI